MGSHWGGWGEGDGIVWFVDMLVVRGLGARGRDAGFAALAGCWVLTYVSVEEA